MTAATETVAARDWRQLAACRTVDPELFFPAAEVGSAYDAQVGAAKAVCAGCPVRDACLEFALTALPHGIAGGMTADERRTVRSASPYVDSSGRLVGASRDDTAVVGRAQLANGRRGRVVQHEFGVSRRTVERWARQAREQRRLMEEGSTGGHRAPLQTSQQCNPQAGTRTTEGVEGR